MAPPPTQDTKERSPSATSGDPAEPPTWRHRAACAGTNPAAFYPDSDRVIPTAARTLCDTCPVRADCLAHALRHERHGIWGGTSERQRRRLRSAAGITVTEPDPDTWTPT